jgi:YVTN family beta-propeller protein
MREERGSVARPDEPHSFGLLTAGSLARAPEEHAVQNLRPLPGLVIVALLEFAAPGANAAAGEAPADPHVVYVTNEASGDLSVIDGATHTVVATLPLGKRPRGVELSADRRALYVALSGSPIAGPGVDESKLPPADKTADGIGVIDRTSGRLERVIRGVSDPEQVAAAPDGRTLFVASEDTGRAVFVDSRSGRTRATASVGGEPEGIAVRPDGRVVYVTSESDSSIAVLDARTARVITHVAVGERPRGIAFTRDGARAYVTCELAGTVAVIDARTHRLLASPRMPGDAPRPMGVALAPDGRTVWVTTGRGGLLVALDATTLQVRGSVPVGERPWGVAASTDGRYVYTANGPSNDVSVVDATTLQVTRRVPVGSRPWGVIVAPAVGAPASESAPVRRP